MLLARRLPQSIRSVIFVQARTVNAGTQGFVLRPYQEACLKACTDALASGVSRIGVSLPTGAGKTTVFIALLDRIPAKATGSGLSLIIVNTVELAHQTAAQLRRLVPALSVEIEQGTHQASGCADV